MHDAEPLIGVDMSSDYNNTHCGLSPQTLVASILPPVLIVELLLGLPGNLLAFCVFRCPF